MGEVRGSPSIGGSKEKSYYNLHISLGEVRGKFLHLFRGKSGGSFSIVKNNMELRFGRGLSLNTINHADRVWLER